MAVGGVLFGVGWPTFVEILAMLNVSAARNIGENLGSIAPVFVGLGAATLFTVRFHFLKAKENKIYKLSLPAKLFLLVVVAAAFFLACFRTYMIVVSSNAELQIGQLIILMTLFTMLGMVCGAFLGAKSRLEDFRFDNPFKLR